MLLKNKLFIEQVSTAAGGGLFGPGTKSVSSLVRFALSSNFPSGLLNTAQSYPTLNLGGPPATGGHPGGVPATASMSETDQVSCLLLKVLIFHITFLYASICNIQNFISPVQKS